MARILLYYPAINIPNNAWLRSSLLYCDKVASILPFANMQDEGVDDITKFLYDSELYEPISVFDGIHLAHKDVSQFEKAFTDIISSPEFENIKKKRMLSTSKNKRLSDYEIYLNKLTWNIASHLKHENLMKELSNGKVLVEKNAAVLYMSLLSDFLARTNRYNVVIPSTDNIQHEQLVYQLHNNTSPSYRLQLLNCLPVPASGYDLKEIIEFKKSRSIELSNFRNVLDSFEKELITCSSTEEQRLKLQQFREKIVMEVEKIKQAKAYANIKLVMSSLSSLMSYKQPDLIKVGDMGINGPALAAAVTFANQSIGVLILGLTWVSSFIEMKRAIEANSYSYIYHAGKSKILGTDLLK